MAQRHEKNSQSYLPDHSAAKVQLLGGYLKRFLNIIANDGYTQRIKIYDLFCGEGIYGNQGEGSPIVIMRAVKELYFARTSRSKKPPFVDCYFNDNDAEKVANVMRSIEIEKLHYPEIGHLGFSRHGYEEIVKELSAK